MKISEPTILTSYFILVCLNENYCIQGVPKNVPLGEGQTSPKGTFFWDTWYFLY